MAFIDQLKKICDDKNISMDVLARSAGVSSSAVTKWRNGSLPRTSTLRAIADKYGVTVDWLMGDDPLPTVWDSKQESSAYMPLSSADKFILDMYHELDEEGRTRYMQMCMRVNDEELRRMRGE